MPTINLILTDKLHKKLKVYSAKHGITQSDLLRKKISQLGGKRKWKHPKDMKNKTL